MSADSEVQLQRLETLASPCGLCPRQCGTPRLGDGSEGDLGHCGVRGAGQVLVSSTFAHFGEEEVLVGLSTNSRRRGSGTIFLCGCNLKCLFCQNFATSRASEPHSVFDPAGVADLCLDLQRAGCANVNFVTPTHYAPGLARGVHIARDRGLSLPVVWNCGGYESLEVVRCLEGSVQIYMPDFKSLDAEFCKRYLNAPNYPEAVVAAIAEMARQVGPLTVGPSGLAERGLLVRHLVMPGMDRDSLAVIDRLADLCPGAGINIMGQYRPCGRAHEYPGLSQRPGTEAVRRLRKHATRRGLVDLNA